MPKTQVRYKQNRLQQLRGFCHVSQTGSVSKAAEKMFLTQPSVSLQIQALEQELKAALFERNGPKLSLTHDGKILYDLARPLINGFEDLENEFEAKRESEDRGRISIAAGGSTIQYVLPQYVERFLAKHPKVDLKLVNVLGKEGMALLRSGEVDFCVGPMLNIPDDIEFTPVVSYDPVLIAPKKHPLSKRKKITLHDITQYPLILPPQHMSSWRQVQFIFEQEGLKYNVKLEVGGYEVIKKYVSLGMGISIVMNNCINDDEDLEIIPVGKYFPVRTYGVVLRKGRELSPTAKAFVKFLDPDAGKNIRTK